jgi:His/Glu/Gln/Arg/opine family amino acid ABC transporter permease subunit
MEEGVAARDLRQQPSKSIPFYRNVKVIAVLAQVIFLVLVLLGLGIIVKNVISGVNKLGVPLGYSWVDDRSGIPLTESVIPYTPENTYGRVLLVGFLNTLKVSLVGVVLATFLGIAVALMRLSGNWMLRQIATVYVETIRNIPLAIQIFFWFTVIFIPSFPSGVSAYKLLNGFLNNSGLIVPWLNVTQSAVAWLPWLVIGLIAAVILFIIRRGHIIRSERPGNPWLLPLLVFILLAGLGYVFAYITAKYPEGLTVELDPKKGRVTTYIDTNGNAEFDKRVDQRVRAVPVQVNATSETYLAIPDNRSEVGTTIYSGFRFPRFTKGEYSNAEVSFVNPELSSQLKLHFLNFPSIGQIYNDRNGNNTFDAGEERRTLEEIAQTATPELGFEGDLYQVQLKLEGFKRTVVTDFEGEANIPDLKSGQGLSTTILRASPLVLNKPTFPSERTQVQGGFTFTNAYISLLLALVFYTASFIAEIVRGGILAIPKGQREAAKALGLSNSQTFRLVVFPQAMRIIIPPLISEYLNLTKNSSLGFFAAYNEFFKISEITSNQSGATVPVILVLIFGYLAISLIFSLILNVFNSRVQLVER